MSLAAAIESALSRPGLVPGPSGLVALSLPVELDVETAFASASRAGGALFFWDARTAETVTRERFACFGVARAVEGDGPTRFDAVGAATQEVLAGLGGPRLDPARAPRFVGAFTFDATGGGDAAWPLPGARLVLPRATLVDRPGEPTTLTLVLAPDELRRPAEVARNLERELETSPSARAGKKRRGDPSVADDGARAFVENVRDALVEIAAGRLEKVVLARRSRVDGAPRAEVVLAALAASEGAVRFAFTQGTSTFLGASPELLASVDDGVLRTEALAGSEPRAGFELAEVQRLLLRDKDRREHAIVVDAITEALRAASCAVTVEETRVRTVPSVHHLVTPFTAVLPRDVGVLDVVARLHPTPALGGAPRADALRFVASREQRGPYAGPVGWVGAGGRGAFVVGIRSALLGPDQAYVYAGAGVVAGSVPALELAETRAKESAMLRAMGAAPPAPRRRGAEATP